MNKKSYLFLILILFFIASCTKDDPIEIIPTPENIINSYIFMGHTYASNNTIDERLESFNFVPYEQIWLGGDICAETTKDYGTLVYLDGLFDWKVKTHIGLWVTMMSEMEILIGL